MERITNVINDFLAQFELTATPSENFNYNFEDNTVGYSLVVPTEGYEYLTEFLHSIAPDIVCDIFLLSLLHEIGHSETWGAISEDEEIECRGIKRRINFAMSCAEGDIIKNLYFEYFNLIDEYDATMWAVNYMRNNVETISKFWKKLQAEIMAFYIREGVEF